MWGNDIIFFNNYCLKRSFPRYIKYFLNDISIHRVVNTRLFFISTIKVHVSLNTYFYLKKKNG